MISISRKKLGWFALVLGGGALALYGFLPTPVPIDSAIIERGDVIVSIEDEGISQVKEVYRVSSPISGTVKRLPVEIGDEVVKGQTIVASVLPAAPAFLDARNVQMGEASVKAAEAALKLAQANHERAATEAAFWNKQLGRIENLRVGSTISERTVDQTRMESQARIAAEQSAQAEVDLRTRELERAKAALVQPSSTYSDAGGERCCLRIAAPENGVILNIQNESETVITAGAPLLEIGNPRELEIVVDLLSRDAVRVKPGARAVIDAWGGKPLNARVRRIDRAGFTKISSLGIEEQRVKVWLDLTDPPETWERLGHDYRVIVKIVVDEVKDSLRIPVSALFRHGENWATFTRANGQANLTELKIAEKNFEWAIVEKGLALKDRVILYPSDRLADGVSVEERKTE